MPSTLMTSTSWKPASAQGRQIVGGEFVARFDIDFAGFRIDHVERAEAADQFVFGEGDGLDALFLQLAQAAHGDLGAGFQNDIAGLGVLPVRLVDLALRIQAWIQRRGPAAVLLTLEGDLGIEIAQDLFLGQAQRIEQRRRRQLAAAVDADVNDVLGVEFEVEPGAAIGNDAGGEQQLARGMGLALVMVEEDARASGASGRR